MSPCSHPTAPLDVLVGYVHGAVPPAIAGARRDFAGVVARARALGFVAIEQGGSQVIDIRSVRQAEREPGDVVLDGLVGAARIAMARRIEARRAQPIPPLRRRPRGLAPYVAAVALAAAAVVATLGALVPQGLRHEAVPTSAPTQAHHQRGDDVRSEVAHARDAVPVRPRVDARPFASPTPIEPARIDASRPSVRARARATVHVERARELSDRAAAAWRAGDRGTAESLYLEVTRIAGRSTLAELAWGDLFALATQRGDQLALAKRWRGYLRAFPRGRYVDDARAGLCRTSSDARACWARYLAEVPAGSYRAEAERAGATPDR